MYTTYNLIEELNVKGKDITIVAEFFPGDQSINYTSPWAGGNFSCISPTDKQTLKFDKLTYTNLGRLQKKLGGAKCGLDQRQSIEYFDSVPSGRKIESLKSYLKGFKILDKGALPPGVEFGISFTTWVFNCPFFLSNFINYLQNEKGVKVLRKKLTHISQGYLSSKTKVVFNCSGIGAKQLGGVQDTKVYPTRGQVVVVRAPHIQLNKMRWGDDYATYIIPRPFSNDELVLGGFLQKDNWTADTFASETQDIIKRCTELLPEILDKPLEIVKVVAGLRPSRHGGVRIELEKAEDGKILVHNYGASGYGYQAGFGMAREAVKLLQKQKRSSGKL